MISDLVTLPVDPVAKVRFVAKAVAIVLAVIALVAGAIWLYNRLQEAPKQKAAQAQLDTRISKASTDTETAAVSAFANKVTTDNTIREKETHYVETIREVPGASDPVPPALHDAGIAAIRGLRDASDDNSTAPAVSRPSS